MHNNVYLLSETYEDIASGKLQIRRFQPPHSGLTTVLQEKPSNICKKLIFPETSHWPTYLPLIILVYVYYFSHNYLWQSHPLSLKRLARKPSLTWSSHSRSMSFILQSVTGRQVIAYRHIITVSLSPSLRKSKFFSQVTIASLSIISLGMPQITAMHHVCY